MNPLQLASFLKTCVARDEKVNRELAGDETSEIIHLEVDVLGLSAADGPLPFDDDDGDSTDTTLASTIDLLFNRLSVLFRVEVGDGLT